MIKLTSTETRTAAFYMGMHPLLAAAAVRLGSEGVPVGVIARALGMPWADAHNLMLAAKNCGDIATLPPRDWTTRPPCLSSGNPDISDTPATRTKSPTRVPVGSTPATPEVFSSLDEDELVSLCARVFRTTRLQGRLLIPLLKRAETRREILHELINKGSNRETPTNEKMVDVVIYHIRRKLEPFHLTILTERARGFFMSTNDQRKARKLLCDALVCN